MTRQVSIKQAYIRNADPSLLREEYCEVVLLGS